MAATVALLNEPLNFGGGMLFVTGTVTMDSSYPTGGESVTAGQFKGTSFVSVILGASTTGIVPAFDKSAKKVKAFWVDTSTDGAAMAEVVDTTDIATAVFPFVAYMRP